MGATRTKRAENRPYQDELRPTIDRKSPIERRNAPSSEPILSVYRRGSDFFTKIEMRLRPNYCQQPIGRELW
ncbi:hypothetical protein, partial [Telmatospirillum sp.]|uniref:hypothetical protein n=1 Tax=Telmatospirillum sp. TaxID=2079197 RepID=UPI0028412011